MRNCWRNTTSEAQNWSKRIWIIISETKVIFLTRNPKSGPVSVYISVLVHCVCVQLTIFIYCYHHLTVSPSKACCPRKQLIWDWLTALPFAPVRTIMEKLFLKKGWDKPFGIQTYREKKRDEKERERERERDGQRERVCERERERDTHREK